MASLNPIGMFSLLAMLTALGWLGWRLAGFIAPDDSRAARLVSSFCMAVASVAATATVLGHLGILRFYPFLLAVLCQCLIAQRLPAAVVPRERAWTWPESWSLAAVDQALLAAACAALCLRFAGSVAHIYWDPGAFLGYDDLSYHLPAVATWNHYGDLRALKLEVGDHSTTFYPFVAELCSWAMLAPFGNNDVLARRIQLPFALFSLLAVFVVARRLGLGRRSALWAAMLYASVDRAFPGLALGAGNDHAAAFFTLAGLDACLALLERPKLGRALYAGSTLGLLVGTKYIGLLGAATLVGFSVLLWAASSQGFVRGPGPAVGRRLQEVGIGAIAVVAALVFCGGYPYIRNAWATGNPFFPAPLTLFGHSVLPGWAEATLGWRRQLPEFRIEVATFLTTRSDIFGPLFAWTILPGAVLGPILAVGKKRLRLAVTLALPTVLFLEFRYLMHDHRDLRYILAAIAIGAIAAAWTIEAAGRPAGIFLRAAASLFALQAAASHLFTSRALEAVFMVGLALGAGIAAQRIGLRMCSVEERGRPRPSVSAVGLRFGPGVRVSVGIVLLVGAALGLDVVLERLRDKAFQNEPAASALEQAVGAAGARVAYVGGNQPYLYSGARLQNLVEIVPTNADEAAEYYTWGGSAGFPFANGWYEQWRRNLQQRGIRFVVADRLELGPEREWIVRHRRAFRPLYRDARTEIWSLAESAR